MTMPNGMTLEQSYEAKRDLLADMDYKRGTTLVSRRAYAYDALGRPTARTLLRQGTTRRDVFSYNGRSELAAATLGTDAYAYDYDNIGNRKTAREIEEEFAYTANELNQYTSIEQSIPNSSLSPPGNSLLSPPMTLTATRRKSEPLSASGRRNTTRSTVQCASPARRRTAR